jgi:DNA-binding response OmpR family regulator
MFVARSSPPELLTPRTRVLIADDEAHVREVLRRFLTCEGYLVSAVEDGRQVLDTVSTFQADVIVVDMVMPGLTGADVVIALRRAGVNVPVILISAHEVVVGPAFFAVLNKPFSLRALADAVAAAVYQGRSTAHA